MSDQKRGMHGIWSGRWTFILAATGSAVGLGNLWKFPYITGENGGGAFVLVYLACIFAVGIPIMLAEVLLGRKTRMSPINAMAKMTEDAGAPKFFQGIGWMGAISGFFILSFYSVIAGWSLAYILKLAGGDFTGTDAVFAGETFGNLVADPVGLTIWHSVFMLLTGVVVARGVNKGLEAALKVLMPLLFVLLLILFGYSLTTPGFSQGVHFLFDFDFSKLTGESFVVALGHAFFTLSLGMGAIMAYGAYMPQDQSLGKTILWVGVLDTVVALIAGMVIFAIVFSNGLEPSSGPGLMFQTLPLAFGNMVGGAFFGTVFFILVAIAAWSSAISIAEPAVAWAVEKGFGRIGATAAVCGFAWFLGLGTVLSFNDWSEYTLFGKTFFDSLDFLTANIMLPLGGLLIAVFVGWFVSADVIKKEADIQNEIVFEIWRFVVRIVSPIAVCFIFLNGLFGFKLEGTAGVVWGVLLFSCIILAIPPYIAFVRNHSFKWAILGLILFTGWSVIGWVVAYVWAFTDSNQSLKIRLLELQNLKSTGVLSVEECDRYRQKLLGKI